MIVDIKKLERQQIGIDKWFNSSKYGAIKDRQGTLNYATGVGKTYTTILIIKRLFRENSKHNVIIIVPSEFLQKQWNLELSNNFIKKELNLISVFTVHWVIINKYKAKTNTLVLDEIHEYLGDEFFGIVNETYIQYDNNLGLTATYEDAKRRHKFLINRFPIIDKIAEKEAIEKGYISSFVEFNLKINLTEEEKAQYNAYTTVISKNMNKFGKNGLDLATKCLGGGKHSDGKKYKGVHYVYGWAGHKGWKSNLNLNNLADKEINDLWNPSKIFGYAKNLLGAIRKRKDLLYNCSNKINIILEILKTFKKQKTIIFSQSTAFADKLNLFLNETIENSSVVYHSNLQTIMLPSPKTGKLIKFGKTRLKAKAIDRIKSGKSRIICTASSLDKGFDVQDVSLGITASGTSNFVQYIQRGGRVKRKDMFNSSKVALLVNLYVKDSKDEIWLNKRQSKNLHKVHFIDNINEISYNPVNSEEFTINDI